MSIKEFQLQICQIISKRLRESGERYIAGGVALNEAVRGKRISRDIDLFHDTVEALETSWIKDRELLEQNGFSVEIVRDVPGFKEALIFRENEKVLVQWARDSAFRFFPLVEDDHMGLVLHPFDLATNKVLALAGRLEPRDWVDVLESHEKIQPFGYLVWAACGKDPGFNPASLLSEAKRSSRYSQAELNELSFSGNPPDAKVLGAKWHEMLKEAGSICEILEGAEPGTCVLDKDGKLCRLTEGRLKAEVKKNRLVFHAGTIKGAFPVIKR